MFHQPKLAITYLTGSLHSTPSWWFKLDNEFPGYDLFSLQISARHISLTVFFVSNEIVHEDLEKLSMLHADFYQALVHLFV